MTQFWEDYNRQYHNKEYIYQDYLKAAIKILEPKTILEVGAGSWRNKKYIPEDVSYYGIDLIDGIDLTETTIIPKHDLIISLGFLCHIEPMKRNRLLNMMKENSIHILMIEPYSNPEQMNEWHGMVNMLWTVNPYNYDFKLVTILDGGYSLSIF